MSMSPSHARDPQARPFRAEKLTERTSAQLFRGPVRRECVPGHRVAPLAATGGFPVPCPGGPSGPRSPRPAEPAPAASALLPAHQVHCASSTKLAHETHTSCAPARGTRPSRSMAKPPPKPHVASAADHLPASAPPRELQIPRPPR